MIPYEQVYDQFCRMAQIDEDSVRNASAFCESAIATLSCRLKTDADSSDIRLVMAAAALALCRYMQAVSTEESDVTSMKAGDVTISKNSALTLDSVKKLAESTLGDARELFIDTAFTFRAI